MSKKAIDAVVATTQLAEAIGTKDFTRAMNLRDAEFFEHNGAYMMTTAADLPHLELSTENVWIIYKISQGT